MTPRQDLGLRVTHTVGDGGEGMNIHLKRVAGPLLRYGLGVGILVYFFRNNEFDWKQLGHVLEPQTFLLLLAIKITIYFLISLRWHRILRELSVPATLGQSASFSCLAVFFTYFLPGNMSSDVAKSFFAARVFGAPGRVVFAIIIDRFVGLFSLLLVLLLGLGWFALSGSPQFTKLWALFAGAPWLALFLTGILALAGLAVVFSFLRRHPKVRELGGVVRSLRSPLFWGSVVGISFLSHFMYAVFLAVAAHQLGLGSVDLLGALIVFPLSSLAMIIPLTPGSLGVGQVVYQYLFDLYAGVPTQGSILFTVVQLMDIIFVILGALYFARVLKTKKKTL